MNRVDPADCGQANCSATPDSNGEFATVESSVMALKKIYPTLDEEARSGLERLLTKPALNDFRDALLLGEINAKKLQTRRDRIIPQAPHAITLIGIGYLVFVFYGLIAALAYTGGYGLALACATACAIFFAKLNSQLDAPPSFLESVLTKPDDEVTEEDATKALKEYRPLIFVGIFALISFGLLIALLTAVLILQFADPLAGSWRTVELILNHALLGVAGFMLGLAAAIGVQAILRRASCKAPFSF
jgi:hypothetical protein